MEQVLEHDEPRVFLLDTVPYLVEHSRKSEREDMKLKAEDFDQRCKELRKTLSTHMAMLKDSIPFWEQFNSNVSDLSQWLAGVNADLSSENVQFGSATVTEKSLIFCRELQLNIQGHTPMVRDVGSLGETLARYVIPEDLEFVMEMVTQLTTGEEHVTRETDEKTELLEERMKSWRVCY